jgi:MFS family permease
MGISVEENDGDSSGRSDGIVREAAPSPPELARACSNIPSLLCAFSASATTGGTSYAFGLYAAALKRTLHLTQGQLDSISTAFFVAGLFSFIPGLCSDRYGTQFAMSLGGVTGAASLLLYWVVARQFVPVPFAYLVPVLSALGIATFLSCALVTGAVFKIIVSSTGSGTKGSAVGAAKGYVGLGAGLYACLFQAIQSQGQSDLDFLPMAAALFITCATIPALFLLPTKEELTNLVLRDDCTPLHFRALYCSLVTLAMMIISNSMLKLYDSARGSATTGTSYGMAFLLLSVWLGPILSLYALPREVHNDYDALALQSDARDDDFDDAEGQDVLTEPDALFTIDDSDLRHPPVLPHIPSPSKQGKHGEKRGLLLRAGSAGKVYGDLEDKFEGSSRVDAVPEAPDVSATPRPDSEEEEEINLNLLQMLQTPTAVPMIWSTIVLVGAGTVETNNMGQMVESLRFDPSVTSAALAFFSVAQAASRVFTGSLSEAALNWNVHSFGIDRGIPRPFFMILASIVGFIAHFILGLARTKWVFVFGVTLAGVAFGMVWPLMVLISAEVFGLPGAGQNYMFYDGVSSAAGTLLLTKFVAQAVYDENTDPNGADAKTCLGMACFRATHMIVAALCVSCIFSSWLMLYTSRHVYNKTSLHVS